MKNLLLLILATLTMPTFANDHLIVQQSPYSVTETADRFSDAVQAKELKLFARIDHAANAAGAELELAPTQVILFGNPKVGTLLMQCAPTMAIDLPQKALIWQDADNNTQLAYPDPHYMKELHNMEGCDAIVDKVSNLLKMLAAEAIK